VGFFGSTRLADPSQHKFESVSFDLVNIQSVVGGLALASGLLLATGCSIVHNTTYLQATRADEAGDYGKAATLYKALSAEEPSSLQQAAQFRLADLLLEGQGVPRDPREALRLWQLVCDGPDQAWRRLASTRLGRVFEQGLPDIEKDRIKAAHYYAKAVAEGNKVAQDGLERVSAYPDVFVARHAEEFQRRDTSPAPAGTMRAYELFKTADYKPALEIFLWHARNGNAEAQAAVASFYKEGLFVTPDPRRYAAWAFLAARNGNRRAQLELGLLYRKSDHLPADDDEAEQWLRAAAAQGVADATNELGVAALYPFGKDRQRDPRLAFRYFTEAAAAGSTHALVNLGDAYLNGIGVARDRNRAREAYTAAAARGHMLARQRLFAEFNVVASVPIVAPGASAAPSATPAKTTAALQESQETSPKQSDTPTAVEVYSRLSRSVLRLYALNPSKKDPGISQGSAVALTPRLAVTNCHVIAKKEAYGAKTTAGLILFRLVAGDTHRDVCLIQTDKDLSPIESIRRYDDLKVGERVYAIGSPEGLENTLSEGIVSGLRVQADTKYVQITAPITHGSSGGGLFDERGRLIGVTTRGATSGNLNFAVAIDAALDILQKVK
jgi:TPR repeat protein